ncbi:MAG: transcription termination factor NusA [Patescibacteria group bacterium]|jgi:N utilization substance protein A
MSEISSAIKQLCEEKNLDYQAVISAVELALAAAYRKDYGERNQNIRVKFDPNTGTSEIFDVKTVVDNLPEAEEAEMLQNLYNPNLKELSKEEFRNDFRNDFRHEIKTEEALTEDGKKKFNPKTDIQVKEAGILKHDAKIGDEIITDLPVPDSYGRMAAQTAKQVIIQKFREMERDTIFGEFKSKEKEVVSGIVQRREGRFVFVDLGKAIGVLPAEEQIYGEHYNPNDRVKVFIKEVREGHKGPEIVLSRRSEEILRKIFYLEIPEVANGLVEIKAVAREAGSRSKVAIWTEAENVDPVGSCVGQRGSRVQTIISELGGEKIDIIEYSEDDAKFIANALAPAKVISIDLDQVEHKAVVKVSSDKLSLAIGKAGQNVRLAARLTGWKIDIIEATEDGEKKVLAVDENSEELTEANEIIKGAEASEVEAEVQDIIEEAAEGEAKATKAVKEKAAPKAKAKKAVKKTKKE